MSDDQSIISGMEPTAATPTSATPPAELAWQDEPDEMLAGSPFTASWRLVAAVAVLITVAAGLLVGVAWMWSHPGQREPVATVPASTLLTPSLTPPTTLAATPPPAVAAPPPATVTVTQPAPTTVQAAVPQIPAAAQEICEMLRQYPGMNRVDVAMTLSDRAPHRPYDTTRPIVDNAVASYCPDQAR